MSKRWRWVRRGLVAAGVLLGVLVVGIAAFFLWIRTPTGNRALTAALVERVRLKMTEGDFAVGGIETDIFGRAVVHDVKLTDKYGRVLLSANSVRLTYDLWPLVGKRVKVNDIVVDGLVVDLTTDSQGLLDLQRLFGKTEPSPASDEPWAGVPIDFDADKVAVHGASIHYRAPRSEVELVGVNLTGQATGTGARVELKDVAVTTTMTAPYTLPILAHGSITYTGDSLDLGDLLVILPASALHVNGAITDLGGHDVVDMTVEATPLDVHLIQRFAPAQQKLRGTLNGKLALSGNADAMAIKGQLQGTDGTDGTVDVDLRVDALDAALPWQGTVVMNGVQVQDLYDINDNEVALTGTFTGEGHGTKWPAEIVAKGHWAGTTTEVKQPNRDIRFDSVNADLTLNEGVVAFSNVQTTGPLGPQAASGNLNLVSGDLHSQVTGDLVLDALEELGVHDLGGAAKLTLVVDGDVLDANLPMSAHGTVILAPFTYGEDVRFDRVEVGFRWTMRAQRQHVYANVVGDRGVAYATIIPHVESKGVIVEMPPDGNIDVKGPFVASNVSYPSSFAAARLGGDYVVHVPAEGGGNDVTADLVVGPHTVLEQFQGTDGRVHVDMHKSHVAFDVDLKAGPRDMVIARGSTELDSRDMRLDALVFSPTPRQKWVGQGTQLFRLTDGGIADARIAITDANLGTLHVDGTLGTVGPLDAHVVVDNLQLDTFAELYPEKAGGLYGNLDLDVKLGGRADDPRIAGSMDAKSLFLPGFSQFLDASGTFEVDRHAANVDGLVGAGGQSLARLHGTLPVDLDLAAAKLDPNGRVDFTTVLLPGPIERIQMLSETDLGLPSGRVSGTLTAQGLLSDPDFHLSGVAELVVPGWSDSGRIEMDVDRAGSDLGWFAYLREGYAPRGQVSGTGKTRIGEAIAWGLGLGPEPDLSDWTLYADGIDTKIASLGTPIESLLALAGQPVHATGELMGGVVVKGSPMRPQISGGVNWSNGKIGDVGLGAYVALTPDPAGGLTLVSAAQFDNGGNFDVNGLVPIDVDLTKDRADWVLGDLDLAVDGEIPLAIARAFSEDVSKAEGQLAVNGHIGGSPLDPDPTLTASMKDGLVESQTLGVRYSKWDGNLVLDHRQVTFSSSLESSPLQDLSLNVLRRFTEKPGADVVLSGTARLEDWLPKGVDAHVKTDGALLTFRSDRIMQVSSDVRATGDWPALIIDGEVRVDQGLFDYDSADFDTSGYEIDPKIAIHRAGVLAAPEKPPVKIPPFYADFDVNVRLDLARNMEVRAKLPIVDDYGALGAMVSTAQVDARLASRDLVATLRNGELNLMHDVEIVEGQVSILRSTFDIKNGSLLSFEGDPVNPRLDLSADMTVPNNGGTINLHVTNYADDPELQYTADPPMDETEIFTVLLTGEAPEDLAGGGDPTATAGMLLNGIFGQVQSHSVTVDPDGKLRTRVPLTPHVQAEVTFDPFRVQDQHENLYTFSVEAGLWGNVLLDAAWGDELKNVDLFWEHRF